MNGFLGKVFVRFILPFWMVFLVGRELLVLFVAKGPQILELCSYFFPRSVAKGSSAERVCVTDRYQNIVESYTYI